MSSTAKFEDSFTESSDTDLDQHSPDFGSSWSVGVDNGGVLEVVASVDTLKPASVESDKGILYVIDDALANDQWCESYCINSDSAEYPQQLALRFTDSTHWYAINYKNGQIIFYLTNGGSPSPFLIVNTALMADYVIVGFEFVGVTAKIYVDGIQVGLKGNTALASGVAGIGAGGVANVFRDLDPDEQEAGWFRAGDDGYLASFEFLDTFTEASDTDLDLHTPDVGTSWTELIQVSAAELEVEATTDRLHPKTNESSDGVAYTADESSVNHRVGCRVENLSGYWFLLARIQDTDNFYALEFYEDSNSGRLYKKVSGSWSVLSTSFIITQNDFLELEVDGSFIRARINGTIVEEAVDGSITASGKPGIGAGALRQAARSVFTSDYINHFRVVPVPVSPDINISGSIDAVSTMAGLLSVIKNIAGAIDAISTMVGTIVEIVFRGCCGKVVVKAGEGAKGSNIVESGEGAKGSVTWKRL